MHANHVDPDADDPRPVRDDASTLNDMRLAARGDATRARVGVAAR